MIDLLRDPHRLGDVVHLEPAAEAAAEELVVHRDLVERQAGDLGRRCLGPADDLGADPHVAAVAAHMHGAVDRLHGGMRQERRLVDGFDLGGGRLERGGGVAHALRDRSFLLGCLRHGGHDVGRAERGIGPVVELDGGGLEALLGGPIVIGDHGHGVVEGDDAVHARDLQRGRFVEGADRAAEDGRRGDRGDLHARHLHVDAEHRGAVHLPGHVEPLGRRADDAEGARILELHLGRARAASPPHPPGRRSSGDGCSRHGRRTPLSVWQPAGSTFQLSAAAAISIARAAAPAWRSGMKKARTEVEPPVTWKPRSGLAKRLSSAGACSTCTWARSTSSSSAISIAIEV